jgi:L-aminopeptidase/D-esterase-like protein
MMKSGLGTYAVSVGGIQCGAVVAVNALGDVFDLDTGRQLAGILNEEKTGLDSTTRIMTEEIQRGRNVFSGNTTIGCILTNGALTKPQANKLASLAHNGLARVIRPVHTSVDGDSIFALSSGQAEVSPDGLGVLAAEVMARAVNRAVLTARSAYGLTGAAELLSERAD